MNAETSLFPQAFGLAAAFLGNAIQAMGFVLQKKGVAWIGRKAFEYPEFRRDRAVWVLGFAAINVVPVFQFLALGSISAAVLGSMTGICVVLTVVFSAIFLGDRILPSDWAWSFVVLLGIGAASYFGTEGENPGYSATAAAAVAILPAAASLPFFLFPSLRGRKLAKASFFAAFAGAASGAMIVLLKALRMDCGSDLPAYLASPWLYLYAADGAFSLAILQFAYKSGKMIVIAPIQYGTLVLYPVLASFLIFGSKPVPLQLLAFAAIVLSVFMIVRRRGR